MLNEEQTDQQARCRQSQCEAEPVADIQGQPHRHPAQQEETCREGNLEDAARMTRFLIPGKRFNPGPCFGICIGGCCQDVTIHVKPLQIINPGAATWTAHAVRTNAAKMVRLYCTRPYWTRQLSPGDKVTGEPGTKAGVDSSVPPTGGCIINRFIKTASKTNSLHAV